MAVSLTSTVTDAQAARVAVALGHITSMNDLTWVNATMADVRTWILAQIRRRTLDYEHAQATITDANTRESETW